MRDTEPAPAPYTPPPAFAPPDHRAPPLDGPPPEAVRASSPARAGAASHPVWAVSGRAALAVAAALALTVGALTLVLLRPSTTPTAQPLRLPDSVAGYHERVGQETSYLSELVRGRVASLTGRAASDYAGSLVGVYSRRVGDPPDVLFAGLDRTRAPRALFAAGSAGTNLSLLLGAGPLVDVTRYPAGGHGAALACATSVDGAVALCAWFDDAHLGVVLDVRASMEQPALAGLTRALRERAER